MKVILIAVVKRDAAEKPACDTEEKTLWGKDANIIGEVSESPEGKVLLKTRIGGTRMIDMFSGGTASEDMLKQECKMHDA